MVAKVTMAKTRVYADEPQVYIVSGLFDNQYANYWKFERERYTYTDGTGGGSVYLNEPGKSYTWEEISDSANFSFDPADIPAGLPTAWNMDGVRQALAEDVTWKIIAWNPSTGTMAVYGSPRGVRFPKYRYELHVRTGSSGATYNHEIEWSVIQEDMPPELRAEYEITAPPADTSLQLGDLRLDRLIINNVQDLSAGADISISNTSSNSGSAVVHVEIRDGTGLAVAVVEDASATFQAAPFQYHKTWAVISGLQPSTNYTAHFSVFSPSNELLLSGGGNSFKTNSAPVQITPLDITSISATKTTVARGEPVIFQAHHNNGGLKPITWTWYQNGAQIAGQNHVDSLEFDFQDAGTYVISGGGTDAAGQADIADITITVTSAVWNPEPTTPKGPAGLAVAALFIGGAYALTKAGKRRSFRV